MKSIEEQVLALEPQLIEDRRFFHSHPESGWFTFLTTAKIAARLEELGYEVLLGEKVVKREARLGLGSKEALQAAQERARKILNADEEKYLEFMDDGLTGLVAILDTKKEGPTTAFRFDIDGVDVKESCSSEHKACKENFRADVDFVTHACGHDGHIALGLGLAKMLKDNIENFKGKFKLIFQTAEEGTRGAYAMAEAGILKDLDYLYGAHIGFQAQKSGGLICATTKFLATTKFNVTFKGRSAHAAGAPQEGQNALLAAAQCALNMHQISRHAGGVTRINVGVLKAGSGRNVIAEDGFLACESRGETTELNEYIYGQCENIIKGICEIYQVKAKIEKVGATAGGDSDEFSKELLYKIALESPFITKEDIIKEADLGACEDFSHLMNEVQKQGGKSGYMMIGSKLAAGHHNSCFDFDEASLKNGLDIFFRLAEELNGK